MTKSKSCWKEVNIDSWDTFDDEVRQLEFRTWLFRGHHDATFELKTSFYRMLEDIEILIEKQKGKTLKLLKDQREKILLERFQSTAHLYIHHSLPDKGGGYENRLEWNAIMQHYGTPTRLLDATLSPYIALYFALEAGNSDCCVFAFNHKKLKEYDQKCFADEDYREEVFQNRKGAKSFIIPFEPLMKTERLLSQQGLFLVPSTNYETFNYILDLYDLGGEACIKFLIPASLRFEGIIRLQRMNITTTALFPGLEGFCRSLRFEVMDNLKRLERIY